MARDSAQTSDPDPPVRLVKISDLARAAGVPTATIKYYLRQGFLPGPAKRTSRNMAYYDVRLAERVRAIKRLQRQHFLPLRMIVDMLEPSPSGQLRDDLDDDQRRLLRDPDSAVGITPAGRSTLLEAIREAQLHGLDALVSPRALERYAQAVRAVVEVEVELCSAVPRSLERIGLGIVAAMRSELLDQQARAHRLTETTVDSDADDSKNG